MFGLNSSSFGRVSVGMVVVDEQCLDFMVPELVLERWRASLADGRGFRKCRTSAGSCVGFQLSGIASSSSDVGGYIFVSLHWLRAARLRNCASIHGSMAFAPFSRI
mmetsp:Transcript_60127/g.172662  ORF Transcript_60127/g.172662 Transcript_60127/m.172662 type:complete len:106 (-) Transcript_60127:135-452(-)